MSTPATTADVAAQQRKVKALMKKASLAAKGGVPNIDNAALARIVKSPAEFRKAVIVTDSDPRTLAEIADDWQERDYQALDAGWVAVSKGEMAEDVKLRAYLERGRGHDKTSGLALMALWTLLASKRRLSGVAAAVDRDQAKLLRNAIARLVALNQWLEPFIEVQRYKVANKVTGSELEVISGDAQSSWGLLVDFIVVDELAVWPSGQAEELWHSLFSAAAKKELCMLVVISNAGFGRGKSWNWKVREAARTDEDWYFSRLDGPQASWISRRMLDAQKRILPLPVYMRTWENVWQTGMGDAFPAEIVQRAIVHTAPFSAWAAPYGCAVAGLDLASTRDHASLVALLLNLETSKLRVAVVDDWAPPAGGKISQEAIKQRILYLRSTLRLTTIFYDPYQCLRLAEELTAEGFDMRAVTATSASLTKMATAMLEAFNDEKIELYSGGDGDLLIADLLNLQLVERSYGWRLDSARTAMGHGDRASALAQCLGPSLSTAASFNPHSAGPTMTMPSGMVMQSPEVVTGEDLMRLGAMQDGFEERLGAMRG